MPGARRVGASQRCNRIAFEAPPSVRSGLGDQTYQGLVIVGTRTGFNSRVHQKDLTMIFFPAVRLAFATAALVASMSGASAFELNSPDIAAGGAIPQTFAFNGFGCTGQNVSPALTWSAPPGDAKSFAVFVHDPDAKTGGAGFWHWVAIDIPATARTLPQGAGDSGGKALPSGARQIASDFGAKNWGGPCPPGGEPAHRYIFTVYALKVAKLELPENPTASLTGFIANMNAISSASFTANYGR
jgi:Raf kinase inhibitor-like YbhB/YbcL family protein